MSTTTKLEYPLHLQEQAKAVLDALTPEPPPLRLDAHGTLCVGPTRVRLDILITAYKSGCTPEEIAEDFDSLKLTDIYFIIAYYLRHREVMDAYLAERRKFVEAVEAEIEAEEPAAEIRERLLARRAAQG